MPHFERRKIHHGLTLVEVMLALVILAVGVLAGVELMARIVAAQNPPGIWQSWEPRIIEARKRISEMSYADVSSQTSNGEISMEDLSVSIAAGDESENPSPDNAQALILKIKDPSGNVVASLPMLKIKETP